MSFWKRIEEAFTGTRNPSSPSSPGVNDVQWDPTTGLPIGLNGPPSQDMAQAYQWRNTELVAQRNASLRQQAMGYLRQGTNLTESFRPGGTTSLIAGNYRAMADTALNSQIGETDMLSKWRDEQAYQARKRARRSQNLALGVQLVSTAVGAAVGGPAGAAAGSQVGSSLGQSFAENGGAPYGTPGPQGTQMLGPGYGNTGQATVDFSGYGGQPTAPAQPQGYQTGGGFGGDQRTQSGYTEPEPGTNAKGEKVSGSTPTQSGFDPFSLAKVMHFESTDDGFDDQVDYLTREMLSARMARMAV